MNLNWLRRIVCFFQGHMVKKAGLPYGWSVSHCIFCESETLVYKKPRKKTLIGQMAERQGRTDGIRGES